MRTAATTMIICVSALLALGMVILYSATNVQYGTRFLVLQGFWSGAGVLACLAAAMTDYRWLKRFAWVFYGIAVVALVLVLIPGIGAYRNGSRRWFDFGFASFQPSEAAKLALIVIIASYGEQYQKHIRTFWKGLALPGAIAGLIIIPIFLEPDRGTTILLAAVTGIMLLLAGVRWIYILPPGVALSAGMVYVLVTDPVRMRRIISWLSPEEHKAAGGYQAWQALIALGQGGPFGLGLGNGRQKLGFLPEHQTDFIFSMVGEEMGLIGTVGVVLTFVVFLICGVYIAWHARDTFGLLLAGGITFLVGLQASINIGVVTSALPNKGLALPFISYGGSSLVLMLAAAGVLLSVARGSRREEAENNAADFRHAQFA
jgi:cell division protein FtsW